MTQEDRKILLIDLCARLPYKVEVYYTETIPIATLITINSEKGTCIVYDHSQWYNHRKLGIEEIKPYLRPMSSITNEEYKEYHKTKIKVAVQWDDYDNPIGFEFISTLETFDWLNAHHFDYRGLIKKGLAIKAPKDMYKIDYIS